MDNDLTLSVDRVLDGGVSGLRAPHVRHSWKVRSFVVRVCLHYFASVDR